ncbi:hypothetical protein AJ80_04465 [Polytolypa hystricis UAMH7299]|uniref:Origin recognition complex subunit 3 n=1 Tax=Polytolypa hystricis (strain UAMH7299) TaxID=1447883 RepID=A0A2B7YB57_POLH7|nr:hypothetical protein AJ80_04465 [Polytolypa hystricis UAMH7299]
MPAVGLSIRHSTYVYTPLAKSSSQRASKRRKLSGNQPPPPSEALPFSALLDGKEEQSCVKSRYDVFKEFWATQEQEIQAILRRSDSESFEDVLAFVEQASPESHEGRIPTGLVTFGSNLSAMGRLLELLRTQLQTEGSGRVVTLDSGDASNLKAALKHIIRAATNDTSDGVDMSQDLIEPKLLPYDLDLLRIYVQKKGIQKFVIALRDSEAFDHNVLSDLLLLMNSFLDRIPFVLLVGISTSVGIFEGKLPRSVANTLQGRRFGLHDSGQCVDRVFASLQTRVDGKLWLGHNVSRILLEKSKDYFHSPETFGNSMKYAFMAHFFANPLLVLLSPELPTDQLQAELCEAVRNTPSFRRHVETLLDERKAKAVKQLLHDDAYLTCEVRDGILSGQQKVNEMFQCLDIVVELSQLLGPSQAIVYPELTILALSGELLSSKIVVEMLAAVKRTPSDVLQGIFTVLPTEFNQFDEDLQVLIKNKKGSGPLRSEYDSQHSQHKTTVVGQRVRLTKGKAKLSKQDVEYTSFIERLHTELESYLSTHLIDPQSLFMHEVFIYDLRSPVKDAFAPRSRFAIERALFTPFDYLETSSSTTATQNLSALQPPTCLLYQLYLESGAFVNIYDLWQAFCTIIGGEDGAALDEQLTLSLFYRALSELKMMGMAKYSRKKIDHLAKSAWMGL